MIALAGFSAFHPLPEIFPKQPYQSHATWLELVTAASGGLLIANLAVMARTMMRR